MIPRRLNDGSEGPVDTLKKALQVMYGSSRAGSQPVPNLEPVLMARGPAKLVLTWCTNGTDVDYHYIACIFFINERCTSIYFLGSSKTDVGPEVI